MITNTNISEDSFAKVNNTFTYILPSPSACFPKNSIENVLKGVALRLRRICESDDKFEERSGQYQKYLVARDWKPSKVKTQFSEVTNISREEAIRPKNNSNNFSASCNVITQYNPLLPNIKTIIKKHLLLLHSSHEMLQIFPKDTVNVIYRPNKNLKELKSLSLFPRTISGKTAQFKNVTEDLIFVKVFL